ncbi:MAG TPA: four-carbon acid sugar kinase family protein [Caldilineaceae bacterium]|nr:four-carbon acid sugar kinase family protein [Caldilineaceae bacterium]
MDHLELIILADDVTGAADSAARCVRAGLTATIEISLRAMEAGATPFHQPSTATQSHSEPMSAANVLALSTDSRFLPPALAAERVTAIARQLFQKQRQQHIAGGIPHCRWYKKIDSTLRGNMGAELAALLPLVTPAGQVPCAIIAPAFPAQQRSLVDGYLCYAQLPPRTRHLPTLLAEQCSLSVTTIGLATVRAGPPAISTALHAAQQNASSLIVVDAESDEDLTNLCIAAEETLPHALLCGSAGFVGMLAQQLANAKAHTSRAPDGVTIPKNSDKRHPMLVVVGSGSAMAHQQLDVVRQQRSVVVAAVDPVDPATLDMTELCASDNWREGTQPDVVLHLPKPSADVLLEGAVARQYVATLATAALRVLATMRPPTLLIVGGDTAVHLLQKMGIETLQVFCELLPGMPLTSGTTTTGVRYQIILKAGNHGDAETLLTLLT